MFAKVEGNRVLWQSFIIEFCCRVLLQSLVFEKSCLLTSNSKQGELDKG